MTSGPEVASGRLTEEQTDEAVDDAVAGPAAGLVPAPRDGRRRPRAAAAPEDQNAPAPEASPRPVPNVPLRRRVRLAVARSVVAARRPNTPGGPIAPLLSVHQARHPRADAAVLHRAYAVAEKHHRGQLRKSGEPFITHPLAVATILAELGMDSTTLVAALLHDTVEDTGYTLAQSQADFGLEVAHLIDGVTKLDKVRYGRAAAESETIRKMIVAGGRDLRVLVIKLADRLHNMRTLRYQPRHKQESTARATMDVLVPLADRLGVDLLKRDLESLCFAVLQPERHAETVALDAERAPLRTRLLQPVINQFAADLRAAKLPAKVLNRPRHLFSAYRTTVERGGRGEMLLDPPRVLILINGEPGDCYAALGVVHNRWRPVPGRFKDFIAMPKFNMYQSLHTTVLGPQDEPVDVLIRTEEMHRLAEYGVAAHIRDHAVASGGFSAGSVVGRPQDLPWLRKLLDWQREVADAGEFFSTLRSDLGDSREVLVFAYDAGADADGSAAADTGDVDSAATRSRAITLPEGSTPVDLAYALGSSVGHRTVGARANGRLVSLTSALADGDVVEILTSDSESPGPSRDWLDRVKTPKARVRIRQWFAEQSRDVVIERGRHALEAAFAASPRDMEEAIADDSLLVVALELGHRHLEELYAAVAERRIPAGEVVQRSAERAPPA